MTLPIFQPGFRLFDGQDLNAMVTAINAKTGTGVQRSAVTLATNGAGTITAAGIVDGVVLRTTVASAFTDTTDTGTAIQAASTNTTIGTAWYFTYRNNTKAFATLAAGSGVTITGVSGVPQNSWVEFLVTITALNTVTMLAVAAGRNSVRPTFAAVATADDGTTQTLTAAMIVGADFVAHVSTGGTTPTLTLPLASAIDTALPDLQSGMSFVLRVINSNSGTATVATNTGWTTSGTLTLATNTWREFIITKTGTATYTITQVGVGTNS